MEKGTISIIKDRVTISPVNGEIWLTEHEIAHLLECFVSKVGANVRAILKTGVLDETKVCRTYHYGTGNSVEQYNLEMITALSFRIRSHHADLLRKWVIRKASQMELPKMLIIPVQNPMLN
jgi:hypothetical protein